MASPAGEKGASSSTEVDAAMADMLLTSDDCFMGRLSSFLPWQLGSFRFLVSSKSVRLFAFKTFRRRCRT